MKSTKKDFIANSSNPKWLKGIRVSDPIQFSILYNDWVRNNF